MLYCLANLTLCNGGSYMKTHNVVYEMYTACFDQSDPTSKDVWKFFCCFQNGRDGAIMSQHTISKSPAADGK